MSSPLSLSSRDSALRRKQRKSARAAKRLELRAQAAELAGSENPVSDCLSSEEGERQLGQGYESSDLEQGFRDMVTKSGLFPASAGSENSNKESAAASTAQVTGATGALLKMFDKSQNVLPGGRAAGEGQTEKESGKEHESKHTSVDQSASEGSEKTSLGSQRNPDDPSTEPLDSSLPPHNEGGEGSDTSAGSESRSGSGSGSGTESGGDTGSDSASRGSYSSRGSQSGEGASPSKIRGYVGSDEDV